MEDKMANKHKALYGIITKLEKDAKWYEYMVEDSYNKTKIEGYIKSILYYTQCFPLVENMVVLNYLYGYKNREISRIYGINKKEIKKILKKYLDNNSVRLGDILANTELVYKGCNNRNNAKKYRGFLNHLNLMICSCRTYEEKISDINNIIVEIKDAISTYSPSSIVINWFNKKPDHTKIEDVLRYYLEGGNIGAITYVTGVSEAGIILIVNDFLDESHFKLNKIYNFYLKTICD